jgi:hypothetical protein
MELADSDSAGSWPRFVPSGGSWFAHDKGHGGCHGIHFGGTCETQEAIEAILGD